MIVTCLTQESCQSLISGEENLDIGLDNSHFHIANKKAVLHSIVLAVWLNEIILWDIVNIREPLFCSIGLALILNFKLSIDMRQNKQACEIIFGTVVWKFWLISI